MDGELSIFSITNEIQKEIQEKLNGIASNFRNGSFSGDISTKIDLIQLHLSCLRKFSEINDEIGKYIEENQNFQHLTQVGIRRSLKDFSCQFDGFPQLELEQTPVKDLNETSQSQNATVLPTSVSETIVASTNASFTEFEVDNVDLDESSFIDDVIETQHNIIVPNDVIEHNFEFFYEHCSTQNCEIQESAVQKRKTETWTNEIIDDNKNSNCTFVSDEQPELFFNYNKDAKEITNQILSNDGSFYTCEGEEKAKEGDKIISASFMNNAENISVSSGSNESESIKKMRNRIVNTFNITNDDVVIETLSTKSERQRKTSKNSFFEIKDAELILDDICTFSHIDSPSEFYVQKREDFIQELNETLNDELNDLYFNVSNSYKTKERAKEKIGKFCFAYYKQWYRAEILDWMIEDVLQETENVLLQFVDYGNKIHCSFRNLRRLNELYSKFPKMAIRCHLAECHPPLSSETIKLRSWPDESISALTEVSGVKLQPKRKFSVEYSIKEKNSYAVDLLDVERIDEKTIGEILTDQKVVRQTFVISPLNSTFDFDEDSDSDLEDLNINELMHGYDAKDLQRICRFAKNGTCFKGADCKLEHIDLREDGLTTDKEFVPIMPFESFRLPAKNEWITIVITHFVNSCRFHAQIIRKPRKVPNSEIIYDKDLVVLNENMNSKAQIATFESFRIDPAPGELVLVKIEDYFYRGSVSIANSSNLIDVYLVDLGECISVKRKTLRKMKDEFLHLPFQAIECCLKNFAAKKNINKKQFDDFCNDFLLMKTFQAHVEELYNPLCVDVYDDKGKNIGDVLEKFDFAVMKIGNDVQVPVAKYVPG